MRLIKEGDSSTALFVSNLNQAIGALAALRRSNVGVPRDVSLITCDDDPFLEFLEIPVTGIRMPLLELGRVSVDALIAQIGGAEPCNTVIDTAPELITRDSTGRAVAHGAGSSPARARRRRRTSGE
jgi:LacI family transcriptional regulator